MLNPQMKDWGFYEATRRKAEQLRAEQRDKSEPTKPVWAPVAGRAEQIELNRGGSCAEVITHDVLEPLGVHGTTTELTRSTLPFARAPVKTEVHPTWQSKSAEETRMIAAEG